jgi:hypothetical protein
MPDPNLVNTDDTQYVIEPDGLSWSGDFHYIEDFVPDMDESTKTRVWNRIMESIEND